MRSQNTPGATSTRVPGAGGVACGKFSAAMPPSCGLMGGLAILDALENSGDALSDADAHGDERIAPLTPMQLPNGGKREPRSRSAKRMSDRDGPAVGIDPR